MQHRFSFINKTTFCEDVALRTSNEENKRGMILLEGKIR